MASKPSGLSRKRPRVSTNLIASVPNQGGSNPRTVDFEDDEHEEIWHSTPVDKPRFTDDDDDEEDMFPPPPSASPVREPSPLFVPDDLPVDDDDEETVGEMEAGQPAKTLGGGGFVPEDEDEDGDHEMAEAEPVVLHYGSEENLFCSLVKRWGILLTEPRITMKNDELVFRKQLNDWLGGKISGEGGRKGTKELVKSMKKYFENDKNLVPALYPCFIKGKGKTTQPSLMHMLLNVEGLQKFISGFLLSRLANYSLTVDNADDLRELILILEQFKWVNSWEDPVSFCKELIDYTDSGTPLAQREIVRALPEIIPEQCHQQLAESLMAMFEKGENVPTIMECLTDLNLNLPEEQMEQINKSAFEQMINAPIADFPAYFGFLFRSKIPKELEWIIDMIRPRLEISTIGFDRKNDIHMGEIVEKIRFITALNPNIVSAWNKIMKKVFMVEGKIYPVDMLMLFIFAESFKGSLPILKGIFAQKEVAIELFKFISENNMPIIIKILEPFLKICDSIISEKEDVPAQVVGEILVDLFIRLDLYEAQEIIQIFCANFINGSYKSRSAVLDSLSHLAELNPTKMLTFYIHLMQILDYIERFPPFHLKGILNIFAQLAHIEGNPDSEALRSQLHIMCRKQLTHTKLQTRCFGVISNLAVIRQICSNRGPENLFTEGEIERIGEMMKIAWSFIEKDEDPCIIFFDELCEIVGLLPKEILETYEEIFREKFLESWTLEDEEIDRRKVKSSLTLDLQFGVNANPKDDGEIAFVIEGKSLGMSPFVVPSHFKLVRMMQAELNGNLGEIASFIGAPIFFPKYSVYLDNELDFAGCTYAQKDKLGIYIILTINFFRELISGFIYSGVKDNEIIVKIWYRLNNLVKLQKFLVIHLNDFEIIPTAYPMDKMDGRALAGNPLGQGSSKGLINQNKAAKKKKRGTKRKATGKKKKPGVKKKKKKQTEEEDEENAEMSDIIVSDMSEDEDSRVMEAPPDEEEEEDEDGAAGGGKGKGKKRGVRYEHIQPSRVYQFLRRLDLKVFTLLKFPLEIAEETNLSSQGLEQTASEASDYSMQNNQPSELLPPPIPATAKVEQIGLETELLLLAELIQQIGDKRKFDIFSVENLLPHICNHLDQLAKFYEDVDGPNQLKWTKFDECFQLLLRLLSIYFDEVKHCGSVKREKLVKYGIGILGKRTEPDSGLFKALNFQGRTQKAVDYISSFTNYMKEPKVAVEYLKFLKNLSSIEELRDDEENLPFKRAIDDAALYYLKRNWKLTPNETTHILEILLQNNMGDITMINEIVDSIIPDDEEMIPNRSDFQACSKGTFHKWYSLLYSYMAQLVYKKSKKIDDFEESRDLWMTAMRIYKKLVLVSMKIDKDSILEPLLKYSRSFLETFMQNGVKILEGICKNDPAKIRQFVNALQKPSRKLHSICAHSKVKRKNFLLRHVPFVRRVLEKLIFRVEDVLTTAGHSDMIRIGKLKNRNLQGKEIVKADNVGTQGSRGSRDPEEVYSEDDDFQNFSQIWNLDLKQKRIAEELARSSPEESDDEEDGSNSMSSRSSVGGNIGEDEEESDKGDEEEEDEEEEEGVRVDDIDDIDLLDDNSSDFNI